MLKSYVPLVILITLTTSRLAAVFSAVALSDVVFSDVAPGAEHHIKCPPLPNDSPIPRNVSK
ncbi:hypothetical protein PI124_g22277 [Phytophthora idaei]|nr:hypothetical protein PI124_g22277 [Phytophthora idaei]